jgi:hexulose-6-phosphate isomerase
MAAWKKSITLRAFPAGMSVQACLALARAAGFDAVEVNLEPSWDWTLESGDVDIRRLAAEIHGAGLAVSAVYSRQQWRTPVTSGDPAAASHGRAIVRRLAECAALLDCDAVLVVLGGVDNGLYAAPPEIVPYDVAYARALDVVAALAAEIAEGPFRGSLCIENVWNKFLLSPLEMRAFIDAIGSPSVGVYFDVGNIMLYGYPEHWIRILGPRIRRVHLKDFRRAVGNLDGFVGLLQGDVNWPAVVSSLADIGYRSYLTAEVLPAYPHHGERLIHECAAAMDAICGDSPAAVAQSV